MRSASGTTPGRLPFVVRVRSPRGRRPRRAGALIAGEPIGRLGTPDEIAAAVRRLCPDAASCATGQELVVDGGRTV